jgi:hypothetical protein
MSYTVEGRLSSALTDLNSAIDDLNNNDARAAMAKINEAIRKTSKQKMLYGERIWKAVELGRPAWNRMGLRCKEEREENG